VTIKWNPHRLARLVGTANDIAGRWKSDPFQRASRFADGPPLGTKTGGLWPAPGVPEPVRDLLNHIGQLGVPGLDGLVGPAPSRAPDPLPHGARFETRNYANEAGSRVYKLYIPSGYSGQALPLVVMLHGCTQGPDDFASGTRMNELAEEQTFLVAYPAQSPAANALKCWTWSCAGDRSLVAGITRQVMREFSVDPECVYVAGFSAGGATAAIMGSEYSDLYAAVGVHSGPACKSSSRKFVPTILFHGDRDIIVPPVNGDKAITRSKAGAELQAAVRRGQVPGGAAYTCTVHADSEGHPVLEHWLLHELGHGWSGGAPRPHTEPRGPDASREMVRFFLAQSRAATGPCV
jgi:poly(hydroxyalkanoate) depolymerase family esterase